MRMKWIRSCKTRTLHSFLLLFPFYSEHGYARVACEQQGDGEGKEHSDAVVIGGSIHA